MPPKKTVGGESTSQPAPSAEHKPAGEPGVSSLLAAPPRVVNVGLEGFADDLRGQGVSVIQLDWAPPPAGDAKLASLLAKLGG
ncbi:MAG: hypothetical protein V3S29_03485 [bacterium]